MKRRMIWETREISYVCHHWVVAERLLDDRGDGWYVSSWSDSGPIIGYWLEEGKFYQAAMNWVTRTTIDLEISGEMNLDSERIRITLEALNLWRSHSKDRNGSHVSEERELHMAAA